MVMDDFFEESLFKQIQDYGWYKFKSSTNTFKTNMYWHESIIKDSAVMLSHDIDKDAPFYEKMMARIGELYRYSRLGEVMIYYWTPGSHIPWHDDGCYTRGITVYLNDEWDPDHGGLFLWNDPDVGIRGLPPKRNRIMVNDDKSSHSVTCLTRGAPIRMTLQAFIWE